MSDTTIIFIEHVLWQPGDDWDEALAHLASRFARVSPLDPDEVRAAGALHEQLGMLEAWASEAKVDLDRELGRWFDEHLAMYVRPAPTVTRAVRALAQAGTLHGASALPPRAAESIARHAGCFRSFSELHAPLRTADEVLAVVEREHAEQIIADAPTPLPPYVERVPLLIAES
ncbi:MAG: hypothetical protein ABI200_03595 [Gaiellales bacterium]